MTTPEKKSKLTRVGPATTLDDEHVMQANSVCTQNRQSACPNPSGRFRQAAE